MTFNEEPVLNLKCIVFTIVLASGYWFVPKRNKWVLLFLLYFPYLILAWYDHVYICERNMGPTYLSLFYAWAKPKNSAQIKEYKDWNPVIKKRVLKVDLAIFVIGLACVPAFLKWSPRV